MPDKIKTPVGDSAITNGTSDVSDSNKKDVFSFYGFWDRVKNSYKKVISGLIVGTAIITAVYINKDKAIVIRGDDGTEIVVPKDSLYSWFDSSGVFSAESLYAADSAKFAELVCANYYGKKYTASFIVEKQGKESSVYVKTGRMLTDPNNVLYAEYDTLVIEKSDKDKSIEIVQKDNAKGYSYLIKPDWSIIEGDYIDYRGYVDPRYLKNWGIQVAINEKDGRHVKVVPKVNKVNGDYVLRIWRDWYIDPTYTSWTNNTEIIINTATSGAAITDSCFDFPILVKLNSLNFNFAQAQGDGGDIRFTKSDNTTHLWHEINNYDSANATANIWVRVDTVFASNASQYIRMYWGNASAADTALADSVWSTAGNSKRGGFEAVYHFENNLTDVTKNANDGTNYGSKDTAFGVIGNGRSFNDYNGNGDTVDLGTNMTMTTEISLEAFCSPIVKITNTNRSIVSRYLGVMLGFRKGVPSFGGYISGTFRETGLDNRDTTVVSQWVHSFGGYSNAAGRQDVWIMGDGYWYNASGNYTSAIDNGEGRWYINSYLTSGGTSNERIIVDELRIYNKEKTREWAQLSYINSKRNDRLISFGLDTIANWPYSKKINFNTSSTGVNISTSQSYFPVLIRVDGDDIDWAQTFDSGPDIRFKDPDGSILNYELVKWDSTNKSGIAWVLVPTVAGNTDTDYISICYGKTEAKSHSNPAGVFDFARNKVAGCWHFDKRTTVYYDSSAFQDATSERNDAHGFQNTVVLGVIDSCLKHTALIKDTLVLSDPGDGFGNEYLGNGADTAFSISTWVKHDEKITTQFNGIISRRGDIALKIDTSGGGGAKGKLQAAIYLKGWRYVSGTTDMYADTSRWYHVAMTWTKNKDSVSVYLNGIREGTDGAAAWDTVLDDQGSWGTANYIYNFGTPTKMRLDEVRIYNAWRNPDWIKLEYENTRADSNKFYSFGYVNPPISVAASFKLDTTYSYNWPDTTGMGIVTCYNMNDTIQDTTFDSINALNCKMKRGRVYINKTAGKYGGALYNAYGDPGDSTQIADNALIDFTTNWSACLWFKADNNPNENGYLFAKNASGAADGFNLYFQGVSNYIRLNAGNSYDTSQTVFVDADSNTYVHFTVTVANTSVNMFRNGVRCGGKTLAGATTANNKQLQILSINGGSGTTSYFNGYADNVIFARAAWEAIQARTIYVSTVTKYRLDTTTTGIIYADTIGKRCDSLQFSTDTTGSWVSYAISSNNRYDFSTYLTENAWNAVYVRGKNNFGNGPTTKYAVYYAVPNNFYWVAASASTWNSSANWSSSPGGAGGAGVPSTNDSAVFNSSFSTNCTVDVHLDSVWLDCKTGYTGRIIFSKPDSLVKYSTYNFGQAKLQIDSLLLIRQAIVTFSSDTNFLKGTLKFKEPFGTINTNEHAFLLEYDDKSSRDTIDLDSFCVFNKLIIRDSGVAWVIAKDLHITNLICSTPKCSLLFNRGDFYPIDSIRVNVRDTNSLVMKGWGFNCQGCWQHAKYITINTTASGGGAGLIADGVGNYPLLVRLNSTNFDFSRCYGDGRDIRFTKGDTAKEALDFEIERWDSLGQEAEIWVQMDTVLKNSDSQGIYMFYSNKSPNILTASSSEATFDTVLGFDAVWHLVDSAAGTGTQNLYKDATWFSRDGHDTVSDTRKAGIIGKGQGFNGNSDMIRINSNINPRATLSNRFITLSAWAKMDSMHDPASGDRIIDKSNGTSGTQPYFWMISSARPGTDTIARCRIKTGSPGTSVEINGKDSLLHKNQWAFITATFDGDSMRLYVNGGLDSIKPLTGEITTSDTIPVVIGNNQLTGRRPYPGTLDEVRVYSKPKNAHWVKMDYMTQKEGSAVLSVNDINMEYCSPDSSWVLSVRYVENSYARWIKWGCADANSDGTAHPTPDPYHQLRPPCLACDDLYPYGSRGIAFYEKPYVDGFKRKQMAADQHKRLLPP